MKLKALNLLINGFISLLKLVARHRRRHVSDFLAGLIFTCSKKVRKRAIANVQIGLPELSKNQAHDIARRSYQSICFGLLESFWMNELAVDITMDDKAKKIFESGSGASISTLHMSCYEVVALAVSRMSNHSTTLSKIPKFLKSGTDIYQQAGIDCVDKRDKSSFFKLVKAVKAGSFVTLHADHFADEVPVTFFGQKTKGPCGSAMLSAMGNKPLLFAYSYLAENGRYQVHFETVSEAAIAKSETKMQIAMQSIYERFESVITSHCEQWYWSYNRWPELQS
ncbi:MAG: lysophospholipid acyltransferase family protein [Parashewanella sp.]